MHFIAFFIHGPDGSVWEHKSFLDWLNSVQPWKVKKLFLIIVLEFFSSKCPIFWKKTIAIFLIVPDYNSPTADQCPAIQGVTNGRPNVTGPVKVGESVSIDCNHGYRPDKDNVLLCQEDGLYDKNVPACLGKWGYQSYVDKDSINWWQNVFL